MERDTKTLLQADSHLLYHYDHIEHGAVRLNKKEINKNLESTSSSNGEASERGTTKKEKTQQKITLPTFEKR